MEAVFGHTCIILTNVFVDTRLWKTKHPRKSRIDEIGGKSEGFKKL